MQTKTDTRQRMTDQELAEVKQALLERKSDLWEVISEDVEDDAREEYQDLNKPFRIDLASRVNSLIWRR